MFVVLYLAYIPFVPDNVLLWICEKDMDVVSFWKRYRLLKANCSLLSGVSNTEIVVIQSWQQHYSSRLKSQTFCKRYTDFNWDQSTTNLTECVHMRFYLHIHVTDFPFSFIFGCIESPMFMYVSCAPLSLSLSHTLWIFVWIFVCILWISSLNGNEQWTFYGCMCAKWQPVGFKFSFQFIFFLLRGSLDWCFADAIFADELPNCRIRFFSPVSYGYSLEYSHLILHAERNFLM